MTLRSLPYLLHLPLHRPHHLAGPTRPWVTLLERIKGAMELPRNLLSSPLPSAPSGAPLEGRGGTPLIVRFPITIESIGKNRWVLHPSEVCARRMTKIFKWGMITEGYCWKSVPDHQKEIYWERWKPYFRWDPSIDEVVVRAAYDANACVRYSALMHELRTLGVRPNFVTDEAWNKYLDYWASANFRARSEKASHNRKNENGGPGTGPSKHTSGTRPLRTYEDILALDKDEDNEVTPNDVFLHVHMKDHDGVTFIDSRLAQFHAKLVRRREEHTQATPDQPIDEEQLYYDAAGSCLKGRVYGLGSLARKTSIYVDPVGMDPACSPQQQHDDDDRDNPDWVDKEHLGDES
ncbi:hypothetical protein Scep_021487 [Stephania cephalantha]|uniref:Uncharacterized protein n=1 Tax=Stephania cephalantha TaxID=152367 RepID=A0AAP0F8K7_9MAGN